MLHTMDEELKKILTNPRALYSVVAILLLLFAVCVVDIYNGLTYKDPMDFKIEWVGESPDYITSQNLSIIKGGVENSIVFEKWRVGDE